MSWIYYDRIITEQDLEGHIGFVYRIDNLVNGKSYIGKKLLHFRKTKQVNKKKKRILVSSDWQTYWGSNDVLQQHVVELGPDNFKRTILYLCQSKSEMSYLELREQIDCRVLESDRWYNQWLAVKVRKDHLKTLIK